MWLYLPQLDLLLLLLTGRLIFVSLLSQLNMFEQDLLLLLLTERLLILVLVLEVDLEDNMKIRYIFLF